MGWWKIDSVENGGIDWNWPEKKNSGVINAIPGEDNENNLYNGDGPADIMDEAIEKIIQEYQNTWKRRPSIEELRAVFNFCTGPYGIEEDL